MNKAFYTGASGLRAYQHNLDIVGHNITNSSTAGYKASVAEFRELIYTNMDANKNREVAENEKVKEGHGVKLQNDDLIFTQGNFQPTEYPLDFCISGDGFFAVSNDDGTTEYTRNGCFDVSIEADGPYLVDSAGRYVLDSNYEKIKLDYKENTQNVIDTDLVKFRLGIFSFDNPNGLIRADGGSFRVSDNSGEPVVAEPGSYKVYEGTLEASNVSLATEMANLIVAQKAYSFSARVVTTADEIEQTVNSLRK